VTVTYSVAAGKATGDGAKLVTTMSATCDKTTPVNLVGGVLTTSTRPTLNLPLLLCVSSMIMSIHPEGMTSSDIVQVNVLNDPAAWRSTRTSTCWGTTRVGRCW